MDVHVCVFEHRHGRDVSVFVKEELAVAEGARIARQWWSEAREQDATLPERPPADDAEAMELYFAAQDGREFFEIATCSVEGQRRQVGVVHVDSAAVIVTDPSYVSRFAQDFDLSVDLNELSTREPRAEGYPYSIGGAWEGRCNTHGAGQMVHVDGRPGAGVVVQSGFGDGEYPVFAEYDEETDRVARLVVEFL